MVLIGLGNWGLGGLFLVREVHGLLNCKAIFLLSPNQVGLMKVDGPDIFDVDLLTCGGLSEFGGFRKAKKLPRLI